MIPTNALLSLIVLVLVVPFCQAANYHQATPPNTIVLGYPAGDVTANQTINVGVDGAGAEVTGDYYGFAWNTSISVVVPNGTHFPAISVSNSLVGSNSCQGTGSSIGPNTNSSQPNAYDAYFIETTSPGSYTIIWNVTYGTSTDSTIANLTHCDLSRLSYQSFLFNKSVNVIPSKTPGVAILPANTKEERTFEPTGFIMSTANNANIVAGSMSLVLLGVFSVVSQTM